MYERMLLFSPDDATNRTAYHPFDPYTSLRNIEAYGMGPDMDSRRNLMQQTAQDVATPIVRHPKLSALGVQLIIFGGRVARDFDGTLADCKSLGFQFVEATLDVLRLPPSLVQDTTLRHELPLSGIHVGFPDIADPESLEQLLTFAANVNASRILCSGCSEGDTQLAADQTVRDLNHAGRLCADRKIEFLYHLFDYVFDTPSHEAAIADIVIGNTDPKLVRFNVDTLWAAVAGRDPVRLIRQVRSRCDYFHIKDGTGLSSRSITRFCPLGEGHVNISACLQAAFESRPPVTLVVEQDRSHGNALNDLRTSLSYLERAIS